MKRHVIGAVLIAAAVMVGSMLSFYGTSAAAPPSRTKVPPFADSAGQRLDMIGQLKEIVSEMKKQNKLLLEQNKLLKSGKLQVVVSIDRNAGR